MCVRCEKRMQTYRCACERIDIESSMGSAVRPSRSGRHRAVRARVQVSSRACERIGISAARVKVRASIEPSMGSAGRPSRPGIKPCARECRHVAVQVRVQACSRASESAGV